MPDLQGFAENIIGIKPSPRRTDAKSLTSDDPILGIL
jgi:hypothetical protein